MEALGAGVLGAGVGVISSSVGTEGSVKFKFESSKVLLVSIVGTADITSIGTTEMVGAGVVGARVVGDEVVGLSLGVAVPSPDGTVELKVFVIGGKDSVGLAVVGAKVVGAKVVGAGVVGPGVGTISSSNGSVSVGATVGTADSSVAIIVKGSAPSKYAPASESYNPPTIAGSMLKQL